MTDTEIAAVQGFKFSMDVAAPVQAAIDAAWLTGKTLL
jgi:hypothetical protein